MYKSVYLIGIGGIGMSAIARYYHHQGCQVSGYDRTPSNITDALAAEGIDVHFTERTDLIPSDKESTLVIYTPAVPAQMKELRYVLENGYRTVKRSRALGEITNGKRTLAVAGTHGKTTTTTLLAHILAGTPEGCSAFLGGISRNYNSNLLLSKGDTIVAEADEFDRSFLQLYPKTAVITAMDADHLDIYETLEAVIEAFVAFGSQTQENLIVKKGLEHHFNTNDIHCRLYTYSAETQADFYANDIHEHSEGVLSFTLHLKDEVIEDCILGVPGRVNIENAVAAAAIAYTEGVPLQTIKEAFLTFKGVARRFDIRYSDNNIIYIDDYAHHPNELSATLKAIKEIYPSRKITALFQPHLYTRTRDFYKEFAASLSLADRVLLLPIYPAREEPIEGITSEIILDRISIKEKSILPKERVLEEVDKIDSGIVVTFGAGDIDRLVEPIETMLKTRC